MQLLWAALLTVLFLLLETGGSLCEYEHCFVVNNSASTGEGSFQEALADARAYNSSVEIRLLSGSFQLPGNGVAFFQDWTDFTLVGVSSKETVIVCQDNMGFSFNNSRNLKFVNISISNCGFEFNTTSVNLTKLEGSNEISFLKSRTGMLFNLCSDLHFEDVNVTGSNGTGITIYNTDGYNYFYRCRLYANNFISPGKPFFPGGGGIVVETSHCYPGDTTCTDSFSVVRETRGASYLFENCLFSFNEAYRNGAYMASFPHGTSHMDLGKGGGLAISLKGRAYNNTIVVKNCVFKFNIAESGGALHLSFGDISIGNSVSICCGTSFRYHNDNIFNVSYQVIGGAVRVTMISFPKKESMELWDGYVSEVYGNSVNFVDTRFSQNFATWGGAVSFTTTRNVPDQVRSNSLHFLRCQFVQDRATLSSSAVDISAWKPGVIDNHERYMVPVIEDCIFNDNELFFYDITDRLVGFGTVYLEGVPAEFRGINLFLENTDTPLVVSSTFVKISNFSVLNFTNNQGRRGGALAFIGDAYMVAGEGTQVVFDSNSVGNDGYGLGGAVYAVHFGNHDRNIRQDCFFQYYRYGISPINWNATFVFTNNSANNEPNSIYTTSLAPCVWYNSGVWDNTPDKDAFCDSNVWVFDGYNRTCHNEIFTGPSKVKIEPFNLKVVPGWKVPFNSRTFDDYNNRISTALLASPEASGKFTVADTTRYILNDEIIIYGSPDDHNKSYNLLFMTPDPRVVASTIKIKVLDCPVGFTRKNCTQPSLKGHICDCICHIAPGMSCTDATKEVFVYKYNCVSPAKDANSSNSLLDVAQCPYNLVPNISLKNLYPDQLSEKLCRKFNRTGRLCSKCLDKYGVSTTAYDYRCVECTKRITYNWFLFLLLELGPLTVICFIVVLFGVSVASPYMNGFVFFAQIVSVKYFHNSFCWIMGVDYIHHDLSKPVTLLYGIWNLDFFRDYVDICLHPKLNTLHVLLINYVKAFYPMMVLLFCYVCIKLYDRNLRIIRIIWKPFRYCVRIVRGSHHSTSIIDAFTTLLILSYTKILYVSFPLVSAVTVYTTTTGNQVTSSKYFYYFHPSVAISESFFYFLIGLITLMVFVGIPPFLLLIYSCSLFRAQVGKMNTRFRIFLQTFGDSFLGGFKDGTNGGFDCRWFGSAYLIFRVIIFGVYISHMKWADQYLTQQILCILGIFLFAVARPYKIDFFNFMDITFFVLLSILNSLSMYNSQILIESPSNKPNKGVFYLNYVLLFLPYAYLIMLIFYFVILERIKHWFNRSKKITKVVGEQTSEYSDEDNREVLTYSDNEEFPDRLLHPDEYSSLTPMSGVLSEASKKKKSHQRARTDKSYFEGGAGSSKPVYGSVGQQDRATAPVLRERASDQ